MPADTSAWIEFLRATGSAADRTLSSLLGEDAQIAVTGMIVQGVLQGWNGDRHADEVQDLLLTCRRVEPVFPETFEHATALYRRCRKSGHAGRAALDCLHAANALEHGVPVLVHDRELEPLRRYCSLLHRCGIAVQRWAEPRTTRDLDLFIFCEFGGEEIALMVYSRSWRRESATPDPSRW